MQNRLATFATWPLALLAASTLLLAAPALGDAEAAMRATDRNGDGKIDRNEFQARQTEVFFAADRDKDGALVAGETPGLTAEVVKRVDRNGDGKVQMEEFLDGRAADFRAADTNGDGALTLQEATAAR